MAWWGCSSPHLTHQSDLWIASYVTPLVIIFSPCPLPKDRLWAHSCSPNWPTGNCKLQPGAWPCAVTNLIQKSFPRSTPLNTEFHLHGLCWSLPLKGEHSAPWHDALASLGIFMPTSSKDRPSRPQYALFNQHDPETCANPVEIILFNMLAGPGSAGLPIIWSGFSSPDTEQGLIEFVLPCKQEKELRWV